MTVWGWGYQEWYTEWTVWGFGWNTHFGRGWKYDELTIYFGPCRWVFLRGPADV